MPNCPLTNVILVFRCIAQLQIMTDKNVIAWHDVGLCKLVGHKAI